MTADMTRRTALGATMRNIDLLRDFDRNLVVIVKDGVIYKNTLPHG
jgi:hypothetical protein